MIELVAVAEAAGFTAGCMAIHAARDRADTLTPVLAYILFGAVLLLFAVMGIRNAADPDSVMAAMAQASTMF